MKVAVEAALGRRAKVNVFGTHYPMPNGTCIRDYIHVSDLVAAHSAALAYLRCGDASTTLNCGYGCGPSVLDVIETVKRIAGVDFMVELGSRRASDPAQIVAACERARSHCTLALLVDGRDRLDDSQRCAMILGGLDQRQSILGKAGTAISRAGVQELRTDASVGADATRDLLHVRSDLLRKIGDLIHERDLHGKERICRVLRELS
jgi:hypothetical protein